ncbi:MAG: low molecular weight protein arginine phosphatase, partial [Acidimicrobiales bacterium]
MSAAPYKILFVCTANICRSPAAEALARHRYGEQDALFRSAGLLDG